MYIKLHVNIQCLKHEYPLHNDFMNCVECSVYSKLTPQIHQDYALLQSDEKEEGFLAAMTRLAATAHPSPLLITFTNGAQSNFVKVGLKW